MKRSGHFICLRESGVPSPMALLHLALALRYPCKDSCRAASQRPLETSCSPPWASVVRTSSLSPACCLLHGLVVTLDASRFPSHPFQLQPQRPPGFGPKPTSSASARCRLFTSVFRRWSPNLDKGCLRHWSDSVVAAHPVVVRINAVTANAPSFACAASPLPLGTDLALSAAVHRSSQYGLSCLPPTRSESGLSHAASLLYLPLPSSVFHVLQSLGS